MRARKKSFDGKTCLITGAASGIGRATARAAAARGAKLVLTDIQEEALAETASLVNGSVLCTAAIDVTDHDAVAAFAAEVHDEHGSVDMVMNIAGVSTWGSVTNLTHDDWQQMIDVNLMGPINVIDAFVPAMIEARRGGHLVNVSSAAGLFGLPWHAAYSASKFGLRGVSEVLRFDLRRYRIGVTLVCPGGVDTPLVGTVKIAGVDSDHPAMRKMTERFRSHAATADEVAKTILDGVERDRYLVLTSRDIKVGYLAQRFFPPAYERAMRIMNSQMVKVGKAARLPAERV